MIPTCIWSTFGKTAKRIDQEIARIKSDGFVASYPHIDKSQLFDNQTDPDEITNLADKPEHAAKVADPMTRLKVDLTAFGNKHPLKVANPEPTELTPPLVKGKANKTRNAKKKPA